MSLHPQIDDLEPLRGAMLDAIRELVMRESPSADKHRLDALAGYLEERFGAQGLDVTRLANDAGGDHLRIVLGGRDRNDAQALVLCHHDTVWPAGTIDRLPFRVDAARASGPGVYDMKASLVLAEFAARAWRALGIEPRRPVVLLVTSDEEIGSPSSRRLIEEEARRSAYVLVLEPPLAGGALKTARKGVGRYTLEIQGRAAHSGVEPEKGISAVVELAHQILAVSALADLKTGTTLNIGVVQGGTSSNVVAASAEARLDARVWTQAEAQRIETALAALRPVLSGASLAIRGGFNRPPMERTPQVAALFERARAIGRTLGIELTEGATGGGSDGNFTAALGIPTLDGLGTPGGGAHAEDEHIQIDALPERAALLATLLLEL
jgi:glutamate carboxypeptidase